MASKRLNFVDMMKGIATLIIVMYHILAPCGFKTFVDHILPSALVAFFFYSGYFYKPGAKSFSENLKTRAKALLIPFFKFSLFFWLIGSIVMVATQVEPIKEAFLCLRNFYGGCIWNRNIQDLFGWEYYHLGKRYSFLADFWFLISLMFASIIFFPIADRVLKSKVKTIISVIILFAITGALRAFQITLPYNLQLVPFWTGWLLLGTLAGQYKLFEIKALEGIKEVVLALISLGIGIAISMYIEPNGNMYRGTFNENEVLNMIYVIVCACLIIWGGSVLCKCAENAGIRVKEISWIGSHSLLIYLYHMFFAWIICQITGFSMKYEEPVEMATVWKSVLLCAVCFTLCVLRYVIEDKIKAGKNKE